MRKPQESVPELELVMEFCKGRVASHSVSGTEKLRWRVLSSLFRTFTRGGIRVLDWCAARTLPPARLPSHLCIGIRGEEDAFFYLRKVGYTIVARNYRSPKYRGEIDLIGWEKDVLCFIEVKTRTSRDVKSAEAAVDRHKRREVAQVARDYLRRLPSCQWRFDVVSVYYDGSNSRPQIEMFRNASLAA